MYLCAHVYECMCTSACVRVHVYVCVCVCVHGCTWVHVGVDVDLFFTAPIILFAVSAPQCEFA